MEVGPLIEARTADLSSQGAYWNKSQSCGGITTAEDVNVPIALSHAFDLLPAEA